MTMCYGRNAQLRRYALIGAVFLCLYGIVRYGPWSVPHDLVPNESDLIANADRVEMVLPCLMDKPWIMHGHNLAAANIHDEFAKDKYGICNATAMDLEDGGLVLDVGGNVGTFAIATLLLYPKARVITVEPLARNRMFIKYNSRANGVADRLTVLPHGISGDGRTLLVKYDAKNPANSRVAKGWKDDGSVEKIPTRSLQAVLNDIHEKVKVLKIDCEGCEQEVLLGTPALLSLKKVGRIVGEVHWIKNPRQRCLFAHFEGNHAKQFHCD